MMNRHERRKKAAQTPRVMKIVAGGMEMTFTPATVERVWKEWEEKNPGKRGATDMPQKDFADACMEALYAGARPLPTGSA
jgi:hypothetical protein